MDIWGAYYHNSGQVASAATRVSFPGSCSGFAEAGSVSATICSVPESTSQQQQHSSGQVSDGARVNTQPLRHVDFQGVQSMLRPDLPLMW